MPDWFVFVMGVFVGVVIGFALGSWTVVGLYALAREHGQEPVE